MGKALIRIIELVLLGTVGLAPVVAAQANSEPVLAVGQVIERVAIPGSEGGSFALYLPRNYTGARKFPVLYCFDPLGRGKVAVERFRKAAERFGYIVIGSNDSKNGLDSKTISGVIASTWNDTHRRFSIDEKRVLAAGFSGGARVAVGLASSCKGCIFGVVGSGAGFPTHLRPTDEMPFVYFGAVGIDDYNYREMRSLQTAMDKARVLFRIEVFDGRHQWLNEPLAEEALAWFETLAMKAERRALDIELIQDQFQRQTAKFERLTEEGRWIDAFQILQRIVVDFAVWRDVTKFDKILTDLKTSPKLKHALAEESKQFRKQQEIASQLTDLGSELLDNASRGKALTKIRDIVRNLRKQSGIEVDGAERRIARRTLNHVFAETLESATFRYEREGNLDLAAVNLELASEIYPEAGQVWFDRARIYAMLGKKKLAMDMLNNAADNGFRDHVRVQTDRSFDSIRKSKEFEMILDRLRTKHS